MPPKGAEASCEQSLAGEAVVVHELNMTLERLRADGSLPANQP